MPYTILFLASLSLVLLVLSDLMALAGKISLYASSGAANRKLHGPDMGATVLLLHRAGTSNVVSDQAGFLTLDDSACGLNTEIAVFGR
ncbi:hypothetical protein Vadar_033854 [Vaccinium darrowii]|uniref:Uncharacterized protein n=1 Tax=Vaccinium darrowii TaxID=229202 RepID=A0ACB7X6V5_9ERIC|nr:hypothetical protein Vadar_033854 [Vaccinium darrowii]